MASAVVEPHDVAVVRVLLRRIGRGGAPRVVRDAANYWASTIRPEMELNEVHEIAAVLRDAGKHWRLSATRRAEARYWAAFFDPPS
jgi:hypothetical protein